MLPENLNNNTKSVTDKITLMSFISILSDTEPSLNFITHLGPFLMFTILH